MKAEFSGTSSTTMLGHPWNGRFLPGATLGAAMAQPSALPRRVAFWFYSLLLGAGVAFYFAWGVLFNSWNLFEPRNMGAYAVTVALVGFGIVGILLYRTPQ